MTSLCRFLNPEKVYPFKGDEKRQFGFDAAAFAELGGEKLSQDSLVKMEQVVLLAIDYHLMVPVPFRRNLLGDVSTSSECLILYSGSLPGLPSVQTTPGLLGGQLCPVGAER